MKTNFLALVLVFALVGPARAAGPFTVNATNDTHAASSSTSPNDSAGHVSLRSAIEAANAQTGATTINVPPGTYNLVLGELDVATNAGKSIVIFATGAATNTFVNQTDGTNRVFNVDPNSRGNNTIGLIGLTIQGGHDQADLAGGAGILAGSITATPKDVLSLGNCIIANNHCSPPNLYYTAQIGGGIQMAGGDLNLSGCIFTNNSSGASQGGAVAFFTQGVNSSLNVSYSYFVNNSVTNTSGSGPDGGGAIFIGSTPGSVSTIGNSIFVGNQALGVSGNTYGGAIEFNTGTLNATNSTFFGNQTTSSTLTGGQGGAIYGDAGTNNPAFCRLVGNTAPNGGGAVYSHNSNGANTVAVNDWWGCNGGPGTSGCDVATADIGIGGLVYNPFIILTNTPSPANLFPGQSNTLTASFINTAGAILTPAQVSTLTGLPVTWNNAVLGTLSNPQLTIQPSGTATATYTAGNTTGTGHASATVDNGVATAAIQIVCPGITAAVSGGETICAGGTAQVTVTVSGGVPPYDITLNNGGGTQSGSSPFTFNVSPATTTNYQLSAGSDADACPVAGSGGATVTVLLPNATIATAASVLANSSGNLASGPAGESRYAWTIANGFIIGPTNQPTVSYIAGVSGTVVLGLTTAIACGAVATSASYVPVMTGLSVHTNLTFASALGTTTMTMAYDGTNYWDCSGGTTTGARLGSYTSAGAPLATYSPGLDFRSIFTSANGTLFARAYNSSIIYQQTNPGVFVPYVTLSGGSLGAQCSVVLNGAGTEYDAVNAGVVSRWNTNGTYLGSVTLQGFGSLSGENNIQQNRGLAAFGNLWLTYNGAGLLSAWDYSGNRLFATALPGAGTASASDFSFSCCNGKVFIVDASGGTWRSFDLFSGAAVALLAAEATAAWTADVTNKIFGVGSFRQVDFIPVYSPSPLPTPAQLRAYQSVLVFSDNGFTDQVGLGNELADYIDQGGGVVMNTFAFDSAPTVGFAIQGRLTNGYMAFTTGGYTYPASLTLVADLPADPLLNGVTNFTGGTECFQNNPISIAAGATQVAHWSNGQPLVGEKIDGLGRFVGLNFFPPSSDAFSPGWVSSTSGARLMANALLWAAQLPTATVPSITSSPADQVVALGQTATFSVGAVGAPPLTYQWRLNGTNLPAATNRVLSVTAQSSTLGQYSVVVANPYGQVASVSASLNPPLRFLPPSWSGNALSLSLANTDGSLVASNRSTRVQLYATTNLALPFDRWWPLTNAVISTSGLLQVNGLTTTNASGLFFRAAEIP